MTEEQRRQAGFNAGRAKRGVHHGLLIAALLTAVAVAAQTTMPAPGNASIRATDLERDLRSLAGDAMQGRLTDTDGNRQAAEFVSSRFARLGLVPAGSDGTYFHRFDLMTTQLGDDNRLRMIGLPLPDARLGSEFYPDPASASGESGGAIVLVGFGIAAPALGHDDYRTVDLDGKVALVLNHEPGEFDPDSPFSGEVTSEESRSVRKILTAQAQGATAVLIAPDLHNHYPPAWAKPANEQHLASPIAPCAPIPACQLAESRTDPRRPDLGRSG